MRWQTCSLSDQQHLQNNTADVMRSFVVLAVFLAVAAGAQYLETVTSIVKSNIEEFDFKY